MAPKKTSKEAHAYRITGDKDGKTVCGCGKKFETEAEWRAHYEKLTIEKERARFEGRAPEMDDAGPGE